MRTAFAITAAISLGWTITSAHLMLSSAADQSSEKHQESLLRASDNNAATPADGGGESAISQICRDCRLS